MNQNLAAKHPTLEQWAAIDSSLNALSEALDVVIVGLSLDDKSRIVKMGDGSVAFCKTAIEVIEDNMALMPSTFDLAEMKRDLETHDRLSQRVTRVTKILERMRNTDTALGSDVMAAALGGYNFLKAAGKREGVNALQQKMGKRFEGGPRAAVEEPDPV